MGAGWGTNRGTGPARGGESPPRSFPAAVAGVGNEPSPTGNGRGTARGLHARPTPHRLGAAGNAAGNGRAARWEAGSRSECHGWGSRRAQTLQMTGPFCPVWSSVWTARRSGPALGDRTTLVSLQVMAPCEVHRQIHGGRPDRGGSNAMRAHARVRDTRLPRQSISFTAGDHPPIRNDVTDGCFGRSKDDTRGTVRHQYRTLAVVPEGAQRPGEDGPFPTPKPTAVPRRPVPVPRHVPHAVPRPWGLAGGPVPHPFPTLFPGRHG